MYLPEGQGSLQVELVAVSLPDTSPWRDAVQGTLKELPAQTGPDREASQAILNSQPESN